jgi:drug/metabolite transporter (DMT)-like permease
MRHDNAAEANPTEQDSGAAPGAERPHRLFSDRRSAAAQTAGRSPHALVGHRQRRGIGPVSIGVGGIQARLMLLLLCLLWGDTWPLMKIALEQIPPLSMRTLTTAFGVVTMLAIGLARGRRPRMPTMKVFGHLFIISLLNVSAFSLLTAFAQTAAATTRVAVLAYTMPIWTVMLAWMILGERPNRMQGIAMALCALGLAILTYPLAANGVPLGLVLAVAAGLTWAAGTVYIKWARLEGDSMGVATWQLVIAFFVIGACLLVFDGRLNLDNADAGALLATAFTGIAGSAIAYILWFEIVRRVPAATASLGILGIPVVGVVSTVLILGERPTTTDIVGFALIFAASACVLLTPHSPAADVKTATP